MQITPSTPHPVAVSGQSTTAAVAAPTDSDGDHDGSTGAAKAATPLPQGATFSKMA